VLILAAAVVAMVASVVSPTAGAILVPDTTAVVRPILTTGVALVAVGATTVTVLARYGCLTPERLPAVPPCPGASHAPLVGLPSCAAAAPT
jgi:hypothetical protein